jgi:hypothetical protein
MLNNLPMLVSSHARIIVVSTIHNAILSHELNKEMFDVVAVYTVRKTLRTDVIITIIAKPCNNSRDSSSSVYKYSHLKVFASGYRCR